jgi:hypothetical protein
MDIKVICTFVASNNFRKDSPSTRVHQSLAAMRTTKFYNEWKDHHDNYKAFSVVERTEDYGHRRFSSRESHARTLPDMFYKSVGKEFQNVRGTNCKREKQGSKPGLFTRMFRICSW